MAWTYEGEPDQIIGTGEDMEFGHDPEQPPSISVERHASAFQDARALTTRKITDLLIAGTPLAKAVEAAGTTIDALRTDTVARRKLAQLRRDFELTTDEMRELVKTSAVEMAVLSEGKERLDALKLMAQMPDVGLTSAYVKTNVTVGVFSDETSKVLAGIDITEG